MPKEIKDIKVFMEMLVQNKEIAKAKTAESKVPEKSFKKTLIVKQTKGVTKFKLRTKSYLYTYKTDRSEVSKKILSNLPSTV
jgi:hypothetical protein